MDEMREACSPQFSRLNKSAGRGIFLGWRMRCSLDVGLGVRVMSRPEGGG
jgi:hypothetical protein